ncbi:MAG: hypothetical protein ACRED0_03365 [Gammaproteobacteria bacterium]
MQRARGQGEQAQLRLPTDRYDSPQIVETIKGNGRAMTYAHKHGKYAPQASRQDLAPYYLSMLATRGEVYVRLWLRSEKPPVDMTLGER